MMKKILTLIILSLLLLTACGKEDTIKIGLILPLTGPGSSIGQIFLEGTQLAVNDINNKGILDKKIELVVEDTASDPKNAVTAMKKLIDVNGVKLFITTLSSHGLAIKPVAIENNVLLFADAAHPKITGDNELIFRHANVADEEGILLANKAINLKAKNVGILYGNDEYGVIFKDNLINSLRKEGINTKVEAFDLKGNDFKTEILKVTKDVDTVIIGAFGPAFNIVVKQVKESGFKGNIILNVGAVLGDLFQVGIAIDEMYYSDYPYTYLDAWQEFKEKYKAVYKKEPKPFHPIPYGTLELITEGIKRSESKDPVKVAKAIKEIREFKGTYETIKINEKGDAIIHLVINQFKS
ncbi:ABC transporter substrate-binding protein [Candidatus Woesearchaeota archaeon]|nr:ABC transporter substrate-binding protein [Candidatus Woesearchaeota archaeon]